METYAEVVGGIVRYVGQCADGFTPQFAHPVECVLASPRTGDPEPGGLWDGETFSPKPIEPIPIQTLAKELLAVSDLVVIRCYEQGLAVNQAWIDYRNALRQCVRGELTTLPTKPEYPSAASTEATQPEDVTHE